MNTLPPFISVIVPVYNDAQRLRRCLSALAQQTYPAERFEVIVIDNGSTTSPRPVVDEFPFCRFVEEVRPGSYAARNCGLQIAKGEIVAFTDADCIPHRDWLAIGAREMCTDPTPGFIGGNVEVFPADSNRPTAVEMYDQVFGLRQDTNISRYGHAATANMFAKRAMFNRFGLFDESLKSGGDMEWGQRLTTHGLPGRYVEGAQVRHPARQHWSDIIRQARRFAGGRQDRKRQSPGRSTNGSSWQSLFRVAVPRLDKIIEARRRLHERGYGGTAWLRVSVVTLVLQYVHLYESLRTRLGFPSERR